MARHEVWFSIPWKELGKAATQFKVWRDGEMFGRLRVRRGGIFWFPANKKYGYRMSWASLSELASKHGVKGYT